MAEPLIVVNFKTYATAMGIQAENLASMMASVTTSARMVGVVSAFDLATINQSSPNLEIWSQHLDPVGMGSFTGWLQPDNAIERGAKGTVINHAEHKVSLNHVEELMKQLPEEFQICACAADVEEAKALAALSPTFIAVEPPELIGGDISVTTADPDIIKSTVDAVKSVNENIRVLCGAGVKNGSDVKMALSLGAEGVLLASGVTKAEDPFEILNDLVSKI
ncbi:MAG: triose-phosphate isomerase [Euryarchaeota archaeon]|mgnify:FL=1|nr:triose-phosphate isomerase [Euryarchaeota archaeon]|tara:strand:+ start:55 stop:717 length:663 start_codon:yes stop_codon:yes gene_type:complete